MCLLVDFLRLGNSIHVQSQQNELVNVCSQAPQLTKSQDKCSRCSDVLGNADLRMFFSKTYISKGTGRQNACRINKLAHFHHIDHISYTPLDRPKAFLQNAPMDSLQNPLGRTKRAMWQHNFF